MEVRPHGGSSRRSTPVYRGHLNKEATATDANLSMVDVASIMCCAQSCAGACANFHVAPGWMNSKMSGIRYEAHKKCNY